MRNANLLSRWGWPLVLAGIGALEIVSSQRGVGYLLVALAVAVWVVRLLKPDSSATPSTLRLYAATLCVAAGVGALLFVGLAIRSFMATSASGDVRGVLFILGATCVSWFAWLGAAAYRRLR